MLLPEIWVHGGCMSFSYVNVYYFFVYYIVYEIFWMFELHFSKSSIVRCSNSCSLSIIPFFYDYMFIIISKINVMFIIVLILIIFSLSYMKYLSSVICLWYNGPLILFLPKHLNSNFFHWQALLISPLFSKQIYRSVVWS